MGLGFCPGIHFDISHCIQSLTAIANQQPATSINRTRIQILGGHSPISELCGFYLGWNLHWRNFIQSHAQHHDHCFCSCLSPLLLHISSNMGESWPLAGLEFIYVEQRYSFVVDKQAGGLFLIFSNLDLFHQSFQGS